MDIDSKMIGHRKRISATSGSASPVPHQGYSTPISTSPMHLETIHLFSEALKFSTDLILQFSISFVILLIHFFPQIQILKFFPIWILGDSAKKETIIFDSLRFQILMQCLYKLAYTVIKLWFRVENKNLGQMGIFTNAYFRI